MYSRSDLSLKGHLGHFSYGKYDWDICDLYCFMVVRGCIERAERFQWGNSALTDESIRYFEEGSKQEVNCWWVSFFFARRGPAGRPIERAPLRPRATARVRPYPGRGPPLRGTASISPKKPTIESPTPWGAIMNFPDQDRQCFVTLSASFGSLAIGREMLRCAQHDRTGFDW